MTDTTPTVAMAHAPDTATRTALIAAVEDLVDAVDAARTATVSGTSQEFEIEIAGSPTGGTYDITIEGTDKIAQQTISVAYNATAAAIQTALRALVGAGLELTVVAATGTTPNFTHTITLKGLQEEITLDADDTDLTGGSSPSATATEATAYAELPRLSENAATVAKNNLIDWAKDLASNLRRT